MSLKEWRLERGVARTIDRAVSQASKEALEKIVPIRKANPGVALIEYVPPNTLSLWSVYGVIRESRAVKWLTLILGVLTAVLIALTAKLALG